MEYSRRHFIGTATAGMGALLLNLRFSGASPAMSVMHDPYETVKLGNTGIATTRLSMGTGIRGGGRQCNLTRLGYGQAIQFIREVYRRGVRMFDLADLYGTHAFVSDALKIYPRKDYVLFSKLWFMRGGIPEAERPDAETVVTRFLRELQTDYIDGVQLHCVTSGNWNTELSDCMTALDKMKQRGAIRSHGLSCHAMAAAETAVHEPWVDTIHVRFNPYSSHMDGKTEEVEPIVKQLHHAGKGVIAMKIIGEGSFSKSDEQRDNSFRYVLQSGAVDVLNIGMDKISDITDTESRIRKVCLKHRR
jgi:aryl-alcohol dehydrogenase-like predicted oxidoreductase